MSRRTEIEVGLTVIVALVVVLWGVTWLKDLSLERKVTVWHVRFPQTGGLGASDEVQVNGIRKGKVRDIRLVDSRVVVDIGLATDVKLSTNSRVAIRNVGLMGEKVISVTLGLPGPMRSTRDTIEGSYELGIPEVVADMGGTFSAIDHLAAELESVAADLKRTGDLHATVANLRATSEQLRDAVRENRKQLHETLVDASAAARTARELTTERADQYRRTLDATERTVPHLEARSTRLDSLRATTQRIGDKLDRGDGSAARLLNDAQLYDETRATLKAMRELLEDLKKNPKKYINVHVF